MPRVYATPEVRKERSYQRAERLERELAPRLWSDPTLTIADLEVLADAWEEADFLGWADNYRAEAERRRRSGPARDERRRSRSTRDRAGRDAVSGCRCAHQRRDARKTRAPTATTSAQRRFISEKIRILRHEGYPPRQAAAIAYRMAGVPRRRSSA